LFGSNNDSFRLTLALTHQSKPWSVRCRARSA
jgi:hypothetical protein